MKIEMTKPETKRECQKRLVEFAVKYGFAKVEALPVLKIIIGTAFEEGWTACQKASAEDANRTR